jgi:hypothetical protein
MNIQFTTPRIPELIISYPFGGMIGRPSGGKKNNHEESGLRSPSGTARGRRRDGSNNANRPPWGK